MYTTDGSVRDGQVLAKTPHSGVLSRKLLQQGVNTSGLGEDDTTGNYGNTSTSPNEAHYCTPPGKCLPLTVHNTNHGCLICKTKPETN